MNDRFERCANLPVESWCGVQDGGARPSSPRRRPRARRGLSTPGRQHARLCVAACTDDTAAILAAHHLLSILLHSFVARMLFVIAAVAAGVVMAASAGYYYWARRKRIAIPDSLGPMLG